MTTDRTDPHHWRCARDLRQARLEAIRTEPSVETLHQLAREIHDHCGHGLLKSHRLAWGLSLDQAVDALNASYGNHPRGLDVRRWRRWEQGEHQDANYQQALCQFFHTDAISLGLIEGHVGSDSSSSHTRAASARVTTICGPTLDVSPSAEVTEILPDDAHKATVEAWPPDLGPDADRRTIERLVIMTADETTQYHNSLSSVSPADVELLYDQATRLARSFANASRLTVFLNARVLRDRAFALLDRRLRTSDARDLYFLAGAICGMLAESTEDLGYRAEALAHTRMAWLCAEQADHNDLKAWILGEQSTIAYIDGRFGQAVDYARRGAQYATTGSVAVWLPAAEARATGALGDAEATRLAIERARAAREQVTASDLDNIGGILTFAEPKQHFYGAESYLGIGDASAVAVEATACIAGYQSGPEEQHAYDNEASSHVNLAAAHVFRGDLDAARDAITPAFDISIERRTAALGQRFDRLNRRLTAPDIRTSRLAVEMRETIEQYLATPVPALPGI